MTDTAAGTPHTSAGTPAWKLAAPVGLVSVATMPLTAIWFLLLGHATLICSAVVAARAGSADASSARLRAGGSIGLALLTGPSIYLGLAVLT